MPLARPWAWAGPSSVCLACFALPLPISPYVRWSDWLGMLGRSRPIFWWFGPNFCSGSTPAPTLIRATFSRKFQGGAQILCRNSGGSPTTPNTSPQQPSPGPSTSTTHEPHYCIPPKRPTGQPGTKQPGGGTRWPCMPNLRPPACSGGSIWGGGGPRGLWAVVMPTRGQQHHPAANILTPCTCNQAHNGGHSPPCCWGRPPTCTLDLILLACTPIPPIPYLAPPLWCSLASLIPYPMQTWPILTRVLRDP